jgi:di/tricarboxylate transporter
MTGEMLFVFALLAVTIALFLSDKLRLDVIAVLVVLTLMLSGLLTPAEALAGFADPVVIMIAGLFVLGEGLLRTGVAHGIGQWVTRTAGDGEGRLIALLMLAVALLSAFMSSTGAVAIFIPVVLSLCARTGMAPSRLLMPIAFASLIGGMLTLIGTPPNLIVSGELRRSGLEPFAFFDFAPIGLVVLAIAVGYILATSRRMLPGADPARAAPQNRLSLRDLAGAYGLTGRLHRLRVRPDSAVSGRSLAEARLRSRYGVVVVAVERQAGRSAAFEPALAQTVMTPGAALYAVAAPEAAQRAAAEEGLTIEPMDAAAERSLAEELGVVEIVVPPRSALAGKTVVESRFRERHRLTALAMTRRGSADADNVADRPLEPGDTVLMSGAWRHIRRAAAERDEFLVSTLPAEIEEVAPNRPRAPVAVLIVLAMLTIMTFGLLPNVAAVLLAALAMVLARCVSMSEAYGAINWESLVLIAGMLPMATALDRTGGITLIVDGLVDSLGAMGPIAMMTGLFVLTSVLSQFISNTATTVLMAPIALGSAAELGVSPYPLLMTVALAASTAFSTPVASPVNTLVLGPGGYRFMDFVKLGVPLQLLAMAVTLLLVPLVFPL